MDTAYRRGQAVATLFRHVFSQAALIVDLPGPEAVAFAAGAADVLDPIFLFDNWPHPRGVVPSHLTLAAAAYFQPLFARHAAPAAAPPMFVLDRNRLAAYTDEETEFDNRYVARVPSAPALRAMDVAHVLYVTPSAADLVELDDLNEDFLLYAGAGIDVKILTAVEIGPDPTAPGDPLPDSVGVPPGGLVPQSGADLRPYYYGFSPETNLWFWYDYPWISPLPHHPHHLVPRTPAMPRPGINYRPAARVTAHSSGFEHPQAVRTVPPLFGTVKVAVARNGMVLGALASRSGSWGRASSQSPGG
jgi:hypothetical protein